MELSELTAYAGEKYQIREERKWADFPGFSVLCHPKTGKWVALLMRQWDSETGTEIQRCDLKCGEDCLFRLSRPYLSAPARMRGSKWIGVAFGPRTESEIVCRLFDLAVSSGDPHGYTVVLDPRPSAGEGSFRDTALPFGERGRPPRENPPERLREMKRLYRYGGEPAESRARNFYRQAVFMEDYEDDLPWSGEFLCYFPTYRDLTTRQLRGYFTWRARARKGEFQRIPLSAAYIYLYELLNGVGAASPEDCLEKLKGFEAGYLDAGFGDKRMRQNLRRWMLEYAVLQDLPGETARGCADPETIEKDEALAVLRDAGNFDDEAVFSSLCVFDHQKICRSPVIAADPERGKRLFSQVWRNALSGALSEKDAFSRCFGEPATRRWYPLSNAVYCQRKKPADRDYALDGCRSYRCRKGLWEVTAFDSLSFDRALFRGLLHEADARLRRYLKTGRYLKEDPADAWVLPAVERAIEADRRAAAEAARPKISIDLSGLERIRRDAAGTRDSLLIGEEPEEAVPETAIRELPAPREEPEGPELPLDGAQVRLLRELLSGGDGAEIIKSEHLMPSVAADLINEALFDEIGDAALIWEGDRLRVAEDYIEDLKRLLGGTLDG